MRTRFVPLAALLLAALTVSAADWPAWRGADRSGVSPEKGLLKTWPKKGPKLVWKADKAGLGYAGMAVVGGVVYTMGARGSDEYAIAFDAKGKEKWATKIGPVHDWDANSYSRGPNATPAVAGDLVFALGSQGDLLAVTKSDGKEKWKVSLPKDLKGQVNDITSGQKNIGWGYSGSPQVDGDQLVCLPGGPDGLFAALDTKDGKVKWRSKAVTDQATYSAPIMATIDGVKQYIAMVQSGVVSVSAKDGSLLWRHKKRKNYPDVVCPTPIVHDGFVYVTADYNGGSEVLKVTGKDGKFKVTSVAVEKIISAPQGGVVLVGDHVYGYHLKRSWACQEFKTGKLAWTKPTTSKTLRAGSTVAADGRLYILADDGKVGLIAADPKEFKLISSFKLPEESKNRKAGGRVWTHPSISDGKLYLRDQEFIFCYQIK